MTQITSEDVIEATHDYLVKGRNDSLAPILNGVHKSKFSRSLKRVEFMVASVEEIKEIDYTLAGGKTPKTNPDT